MSINPRLSPRFGSLLLAAIAFSTFPLASSWAATKTWVSTSGSNWQDGANWSGGLPGSGDNAVFYDSGASAFNIYLGNANASIRSLTFNANAASPVTIHLWQSSGNSTARTLTLGSTETLDISVQTGSHTLTGNVTSGTGNLAFATSGQTRWDVAAGAMLILDARLSGGGSGASFVKTGAGTVVLSRNNGGTGGWNADGNFAINEGTLRLSADFASGHSRAAYTVASGATLELAATLGFRSGGANLTLNGGGVGGVGAIHATTSSLIPFETGDVGKIVLNTHSSIGVDAGATLTISREITGSSINLTKVGSGVLELGGANTYSGGTTLNGGVLSVGANNHLGNASGTLAFGGGTLRSTGTFSMNRTTTLNGGGGTIEVAASQTLTQQGAIGGSGGLTKTGTGELILSGANTYNGNTVVSEGTLILSGGGSIANSAVVEVQSGARLETSGVTFGSGQTVQGKGTIQGNTVIQGTLAPGSSPGILSFEDDLTLDGSNSVFEIQNAGLVRGTDYDGVNVGGLLTYGGTLTLSLTTLVDDGTYDLFAFGIGNWDGNFTDVVFSGGIYSGAFAYDSGSQSWKATDAGGSGQQFTFALGSGDLIIAAIPEPSSILLLTGGLMAVVLLRRRARS